jgi:hypothetical protein
MNSLDTIRQFTRNRFLSRGRTTAAVIVISSAAALAFVAGPDLFPQDDPGSAVLSEMIVTVKEGAFVSVELVKTGYLP